MKLENQYKDHIVENPDGCRAESFRIDEGGFSTILDILRNRMYADKPLAVVREYSCNAKDANVEAGSTDPIEVHAPNVLDPEFRVRDFGKGMSEDQIFDIFVSYGSSTKRNSNKMIGMLGIGSKAGFAYGDAFSVTSYNNGYRTIYNCILDETGKGQVVKLFSEKTDEPSGLCISVPVKSEDISVFQNTIAKFFQYWSSPVTVKGMVYMRRDIPYNGNVHIDGSGFSNQGGGVIMGNVLYAYGSLPKDQFKNLEKEKGIIEHHGFLCTAEIGEIDIAASRETVQYSKKTIDFLTKKINTFIKAYAAKYTDKVKSAQTIWSADAAFNEIPGFLKSFIPKLDWNGLTIDGKYNLSIDDVSKYFDPDTFRISNPYGSWYSQTCRVKTNSNNPNEKIYSFSTNCFNFVDAKTGFIKIISIDPTDSNKITEEKFNTNNRPSHMAVKFKNKAAEEAFCKEFYAKVVETTTAFKMPEKIFTPKNPKHSKHAVHRYNPSATFHSYKPSSVWDVIEFDSDKCTKAYYVQLDRFSPDIANFRTVYKFLESSKKIDANDFVIGFKKSQLEQKEIKKLIDDGKLISFNDYYKKCLEKTTGYAELFVFYERLPALYDYRIESASQLYSLVDAENYKKYQRFTGEISKQKKKFEDEVKANEIPTSILFDLGDTAKNKTRLEVFNRKLDCYKNPLKNIADKYNAIFKSYSKEALEIIKIYLANKPKNP